MREESVARRYAAALFSHAKAAGALEQTGEDLKQVADTISSVPALRAFLNEPMVPRDRKSSMLRNTLGDKVGPATLAFLSLLVDKRRIQMIQMVEDEFAKLLLDHQGIAHAAAVSAVPLTSRQLDDLRKSLEARTNKKIALSADVDPSLIGGVVVRVGDTVYDGTVKDDLNRLRQQLLGKP